MTTMEETEQLLRNLKKMMPNANSDQLKVIALISMNLSLIRNEIFDLRLRLPIETKKESA